jgi:hypothetical protein
MLAEKIASISEISGSHCGEFEDDNFWDIAPVSGR